MRGVVGRLVKGFSGRARRGEAGFTLAEMVISISILGIVAVAIGAAFVVTAHDSVGVSERFSQSHDAQMASTYLATDVQNATQIAPLTCGANVISLSESDGTTANYWYGTQGGEERLTRSICSSGGAVQSAIVLVHNGGGAPTVSCVADCNVGTKPSTVTIDVPTSTSQNGTYSVSLTGATRGQASTKFGTTTGYPPFLLLGGGSISVSGRPSSLIINGTVIANTGSSHSGNGTFAPTNVQAVGSCSGWPNCTVRSTDVPDPFAGLPVPNDSQNPPGQIVGNTLTPGVYCSAVSLANGTITKKTGLYIFEAGFYASGPTKVIGSNVLIFIGRGDNSTCPPSTPSFSLTNKDGFNLAPWNAGPYAGTNLVLWQRGDTAIAISGQTEASAITGVLYAPTAPVNLSSGQGGLSIGAIIAFSVSISGNGGVTVVGT
jgi:prepilin-type N-terminal cleavage/methylation domain-containing protein